MYITNDIQNYTKITNKPLLYAITGFALVLMLPFSYVFAVSPSPNWGTDPDKCDYGTGLGGESYITCCWNSDGEAVENDTPGAKCQTCSPTTEGDFNDCGIISRTSIPTSDTTSPQDGVLEQPENPTPRTSGQSILPGEGVLEQPETSDEKDNLRNSNIGSGVLEQPETSNEDNNENVPLDSGVLKE